MTESPGLPERRFFYEKAVRPHCRARSSDALGRMELRKILALNLAEADVSLIVLCATCGARSNSVFMSGTADTDHRSRRSSSREIVGYSTSVRLRARTHTVLGSYISSTSMFFWKKHIQYSTEHARIPTRGTRDGFKTPSRSAQDRPRSPQDSPRSPKDA